MIIELAKDVAVRIPESDKFHTFKTGTKVNYSSQRNGQHMIHKFVAQTSRHGFLTYRCVTEFTERPDWI